MPSAASSHITCPICGYTDCSLSHRRERLTELGSRFLSRWFLWTALAIVYGIAGGWMRP